MFDSSDLTWRLSDEKLAKAKKSVAAALNADKSSLKCWQKLMGRLNNISQMCNFMKVFRGPINKCIEGIESSAPETTEVSISSQAKEDLKVWAGFLMSEFKWLPIASALEEPSKWSREFVSDAAGLADQQDFAKRPGCGNVGFETEGSIIFANQFIWPKEFITNRRDEKAVRFGDKTTTLEMIGVLIPLLVAPELLAQRHVRILVDCLGTVYGLQNRTAKGDENASIFIRAAYLISAYIGCTLHVQHLPRMSDWGAEVADRMSRRLTTTKQDDIMLSSFTNRKLPVCLLDWFNHPVTDYQLAYSLLDHVKSIL